MRDRLVELIKKAYSQGLKTAFESEENNKSIDEYVADYFLSEGVIVPPCKVGDKAYHLTGIDTRKELDLTDIFEGKVCSISKQEDGLWIFCRYNNGLTYWYKESDIGRKLFFTREQAEKAIAERREG
jgi:hypothetical protein